MEKEQLIALIQDLVASFTSAELQAKLDQTQGDIGQIMSLVLQAQNETLTRHGLDPETGMQSLKESAKKFQDDPDIQELSAKMKSQLSSITSQSK